MVAKETKPKKKKSLSVTAESTLLLVVTLLLFAIAAGIASELVFKDVLAGNMRTIIGNTVTIARDAVDGDKLDEYLETKGASESSTRALRLMQVICDDTDFNYLYIMTPDFENDKVINSLSVRGKEHANLDLYDIGQITEITADDYRDAYHEIMEGESEIEYVYRLDYPFERRDRDHVTGLAPIRNSAGEVVGIMCAECSFSWYKVCLWFYRISLAVVVLVFIILGAVVSTRLLKKRVTRPITAISEEAIRFAYVDTTVGGNLDKLMARKNEIGRLATSIDTMEREVVESIESIKTMAAERERIDAELNIAAKIQEAALPHTFPAFPHRSEFDLYASVNPAKEVGGDFYDFFLIDDNHLALVMADVSGKGVPAALFMMVSKVMVNNHATMLDDPAEVLAAVNDKLAATNEASMFVTVWFAVLEINTGILRCSNGGHEYPAISRKDGAFELIRDKHGLALGLMEDMPYTQYEIQLEPGDTIFVYTDGVPEAKNDKEEFYGTERMTAALTKANDGTAEGTVRGLVSDVNEFVNGAEQFDDLTVLSLRYLGSKA